MRDALIVEPARSTGAERVLPEAFQHGRRFGPVEVWNPFREQPRRA